MKKNTNSAFTLVELIVVITILAVLGTIAFISLQGYSADARNSKRTSDVNNIQSAMGIKQAEGSSLTAFVTVNADTDIATPVFDGAPAVVDDNYFAGIPNYTALAVKASEFKDPNDQDYRIATTSAANGMFEIAASLEDGTDRVSLVKGSYTQRNSTGTVASRSNNIITLAPTDTNKFSRGDTITDGTNTTTVAKIARDGVTITLTDGAGFVVGNSVDFATPNSAGLISVKAGNSTPVLNNTLGADNQAY